MKGIVRIATAGAASIAALTAASALAGPGPQQITFDDDSFQPDNPPAVPVDASVTGDEIVWVGPGTTLPHNVRQDRRLFYSGAPSEDFHEYHEDIAAGKYHYYCEVHGSRSGGMDGVVKIRPSISASNSNSVLIRWADAQAEAKHRYRVEFRRAGANKWKLWKKGTAEPYGQFGKRDEPVNVNPNREYQLRVRTFVKGKKQRRSGWSPKLTFSVDP